MERATRIAAHLAAVTAVAATIVYADTPAPTITVPTTHPAVVERPVAAPEVTSTPTPTYTPTYSPTQNASPIPSPVNVPVKAQPRRDQRVLPVRVASDDGRVAVAVTPYGDCSGRSPLTRVSAGVATCVTRATYILGHTPGVFGGLSGEPTGAGFRVWLSNGQVEHLVVRDKEVLAGHPPYLTGWPVVLQTCYVPDGSENLIVSLG